jgi:DUF4097 and DUF4098 domain-containing protein YvlB
MKRITLFFSYLIIVGGLYSAHAQRTLASTSLEAEQINAITIKGSFCDVIIKPGGRNFVEGIIEGSGDPDDYEIIAEIEGSTLVVEVETSYSNWNRISRAEIIVTVDDVKEIKVDNSSGDIDIERISSGFIVLEASSGDISLEDVIGDRISIETSSGDIRGIDLEGDMRVSSTSGDQQLREIKGDFDAESTSGNITLVYFDGLVRLESTSGDIRVSNGKGLASARTTSGDIEGDDLMIANDLTLDATSGDIYLELMNDPDDLSFDLDSNSGDLQAGRYDGEDELYIKRGSIWVRGKTTSGDIEIDF